MPCYRPQPAQMGYNFLTKKWSKPLLTYPLYRSSDGARVFPRPYYDSSDIGSRSPASRYVTLPCGLCFGCRMDNARMWSLRMMHEARYHENNFFVTLTYDDASLPPDADLRYRDLRLFFVNARHHFQTAAKPFKYFACGEYGDKTLRPHYHFAGFDFKIDDLRPFKQTASGWYFLSESLRSIWKHGHVIVAPLQWDCAAYIARYVTKKMHGSNLRDKGTFDPDTGELDLYTIERAFQSKGLGLPFYEDHHDEIWDLDACLFKGQYLVKPPRYYFKQLEKSDPVKASLIKEKRMADKPLVVIDETRDKELLYEMEARRLQMQTLKRSL